MNEREAVNHLDRASSVQRIFDLPANGDGSGQAQDGSESFSGREAGVAHCLM